MKRWIATLFCVLLLAVSMTAAAEPADTPEDTAGSTTGTTFYPGLTGDPDDPVTTEPSDVTDPTDEPTTTTKEKMRMQTSMTLSYADRVVTVKVVDANGQPVRNAPLAIAADGVLHSAQTSNAGVATLDLSADPQEITASMAAFQGSVFLYEAAKASVVLQTAPPSVRDTTTTTTTTTRTTYTGTTKRLTTTDPALGDVTQIVTVTGTTVLSTDEEEPAAPTAFPRGLALGLIIFGAVLLLAAVLLTYFVLIRKPRDPEEDADDEQSTETPAAPVTEESQEVAAEDEAAVEDAPIAEEGADIYSEAPRSEGQVSLEDLFRNKGE